MALLFTEGMDQYGAAANLPAARTKFEYRVSNATDAYETGGRFGGIRASITGSGEFEKFLDLKGTAISTDELYVGFWISTSRPLSATFTSAGSSAVLLQFRNGLAVTGAHLTLRLSSIGRLFLQRGSTTILTSSFVFVPNRWYWFEMRVVCAATGIFQLRINGALVMDFSGLTVDNTSTTPAGVAGIRFDVGHAGSGNRVSYDDIIVWDNSAGWPNTFPIGPHRITTSMPNGAGTTTQWTPSTGANWQAVDEKPTAAYSESDYVSTNTENFVDIYNMQDLPSTAMDVKAAVANIVGRGTQSQKRIDLAIRSGGTTSFSVEERDLGVFSAPTGTVVFSSVADAGDAITVSDGVNSVLYTFGSGGGDVAPGASTTDSATNLAAAINASRFSGSLDVLATSITSTVTLTNLRLFGGSITETADVGANNVTVTTFSQAVNYNNLVRQIPVIQNPDGAISWTALTFNAAEFGFRLRN